MSLEEKIAELQEEISSLKKKCEEKFTSDPYEPGGFHVTTKEEIRSWKHLIKDKEHLLKWLSELKARREGTWRKHK